MHINCNETNMSFQYLIDYDNVHESGLYGIDALTAEDSVFIFHTSLCDRITLSCLDDVLARVKVILIPPGKQSLAMHLSSFLGFLIGKEITTDTKYTIVSKHCDYRGIAKFWNQSFKKDDKVTCACSIGSSISSEISETVQEAEVYNANISVESPVSCPDDGQEESKVSFSEPELSIDDTPIEDMMLSVKVTRALCRAGYTKSGVIVNLSDEQLLNIWNLGTKSVNEIRLWFEKQKRRISRAELIPNLEEYENDQSERH